MREARDSIKWLCVVLAACVLTGAWAGLAAAADIAFLAQIVKLEGDVSVQRGAAMTLRPRVGPAGVLQGELMSGDRIRSGPESSASVLFGDGTSLVLNQGTVVSVFQTQATSPGAPATRRIKLHLGKLDWEVAKNSAVATQFDLPYGLASVKGTSGSFDVTVDAVSGNLQVEMSLSGGAITFEAKVNGLSYAGGDLAAGQTLTIRSWPGGVVFSTRQDSPPVTFVLENGTTVTVGSGNAAVITIQPDGRINITALTGSVEVQEPGKAPQTLNEGEQASTDAPPGAGPEGGAAGGEAPPIVIKNPASPAI